jgi:hypothetical protein
LPPRWQKPVKLNEASVGVAQLSPSNWHIDCIVASWQRTVTS